MADFPRIEELKRRVQQDPASIAFAALADEYRRAGLFDQAVETCRAGLQRHPAYLSARVTLGRSLLELGEFDEAETELQQVLRAAPENLAAIRALADIHHRRGDVPDRMPDAAAPPAPLAVSAPPADTPATASTVVPFAPPAAPAPAVQAGLAPAPAQTPAEKKPPVEKLVEKPVATPVAAPAVTQDPALPKLERFLAAIQRARLELDSEIDTGR
jgi:tetratricopeptide (TPR) repeat protein